MLLLNTTYRSTAVNLAIEEALLDEAESGNWNREILRVWKPEECFVVIGRGSQIAGEVNLAATAQDGIPVFRRISGGAAIVAGAGCLLYAVMLSLKKRPQLAMVDEAHRFVMEQMLAALQPLVPSMTHNGTCDLVLDGRKFSGNSLRVRRDWLLYHGTLLIDMNLQLIDRYLRYPPREPEYRKHRPHHEFVCNLNCSTHSVEQRLAAQWQAKPEHVALPMELVDQLVREKYSQSSWNEQR
jgi:lipoate---protein ligase